MDNEIKDTELSPYEFGKNWEKFISENFNDQRTLIAKKHLLNRLRLKNLTHKTFIDIGCGSGIHSLSAYLSGADSILSIDVDPHSIKSTLTLWEKAKKPKNWIIKQGSILDKTFIETLGQFDIVYSWGVLHHTGNMWQAIENCSILLKKHAIFYLALYAYEKYQNPSPEYWLDLKRKYNIADSETRQKMENEYAWNYLLKPIADLGKNPLFFISEYQKSRGMEFWTDVRDWLGGFPMEFAKTGDVAKFAYDELNMDIIDINTEEGNTEYILRKFSASNYWDAILAEKREINLPSPITHITGYQYEIAIPQYSSFADITNNHYRSPMLLLENNRLIGYPHARHKSIVEFGEGRFCHWEDKLLFSTSDNTDPRSNHKKYSLLIPK